MTTSPNSQANESEIDLTGVKAPVSESDGLGEVDLSGVKAPLPSDELVSSFHEVKEVNPDKAAQVLEVSKKLGERPEFVAKNLEQAKSLAATPPRSFFEDFAEKAPTAAKLLQERQMMAVAKDDFDSLGWIDSYVHQVSMGWQKGNLESRLAELWAERMADTLSSGSVSSKHQPEIDSLEKELAPIREVDQRSGKNFHPLYQFASQIPNMTRAFVRFGAGEGKTSTVEHNALDEMNAGDVRGAAAGFRPKTSTALDPTDMVGPAVPAAAGGFAAGAGVGALGLGAGALPAGLAGARYASVAGMAMHAYQLEGGNAFQEYSQLKDKSGNPIDPIAAAKAAQTVGMVNAALETTGELVMMKLGSVIGKAAGNVAIDSAVKALGAMDAVPGAGKIAEMLAAHPKVFQGMTVGQAIRQAGKLWIEGMATEMGTEYVQEVSTGLGREAAMNASGQEFSDRKGFADIASDSTGVLYPTFQSMLLPATLGASGHFYNAQREMRQAQSTKEAMLALNDAAAASKLKGRSKELFGKFVEETTKGTPFENVWLNVQDAETYFQSKNIDPSIAFQELGISDQVEAAKEKGGSIAIPAAVWAEKVVGTEHAQGLADDIKLSPDHLSVREAREQSEQREAIFKEESAKAQEAIKADESRKAAWESVYNEMKGKVERAIPEAGMSEAKRKEWTRQAEVIGKVWANRAVAESARRGISVEEYWAQAAKPEIVSEARPYQENVLSKMRGLIEIGEVFQGGLTKDQEGYVTGAFGRHSTFPEWFKGKGYTKEASLNVIDKYLRGEKLTEKQNELLRDLYTNSGLAQVQAPGMESAPFLQSAGLDMSPKILFQGANKVDVKVRQGETGAVLLEPMAPIARTAWIKQVIAATPELQAENLRGETLEELRAEARAFVEEWKGNEKPSPAFGGQVIPIDDTALRYALDPQRKPEDQTRRLKLFAKARAILESAPYADEVRKVGESHYRYGLLGHFSDGDIVRVVVDEKDGRRFLSVFGEPIKKDANSGRASGSKNNITQSAATVNEGKVTEPTENKGENEPLNQAPEDPFFQAEDEPRGSVQFGAESPVITLFANADASTFLHESAHVWLKEAFDYVRANEANLPEQYAKDYTAIAKWLGISADQTALTVDQQEKFARAFEAYLLEGKAPSDSLRRAFRSLRRWLSRVYKSVRSLDIQMDDEVRGIMDRMIATEEEIAQAEANASYQPLPSNIEGVPAELNARLEEFKARAHEEAISILLGQQMKELSEEHKTFLSEQRAKIEEQAKESAKREPIFEAMHEAQARLGSKKAPKALAADYINGKLKEEQVGLFDLVAEAHGFTSGDHMAQAFLSAPNLSERIAQIVKSRMAEFAPLKDRSQIKDEAMKAVHNEKSLELMALEREILVGLIQGAKLAEEQKAIRAQQARIEAEEIKRAAKEEIGKSRVKSATLFAHHFTAEKSAAVKAAKAIAAKEYARAATFKRQQMINHALAVESVKAKKTVEGFQRYLNALREKKRDLFKAEEHFNQVAALLERLGFGRSDYDSQYKSESLAQWADRMEELTNIVNLPDWIRDETQVRNLSELTMDQAQDVVDALRNIMQVANLEKRSLKIMDGVDIEKIAADLRLEANLSVPQDEKVKYAMEPDKLDDLKRFASKYLLSLTKIQTFLRKLDGFRDGGKWQQVFGDSVYKAANEESRRMKDANEGLAKLWESYTPRERKELLEKRVYYPELGTSATKMRLIMMALNLGNQDNKEKLFLNKPVGVEDAIRWDEHTVMALLQKHLDRRDWALVQGHWDLINSLWPDLSKMHKDLTGFSPKKVEAVPFNVVLKDGQVLSIQGGYFPLKEDPRASVRAAELQALDSPLHSEQNPGWKASTKTGHTKARTGAQYAVSLDYSIVYRHMRDVIHDIAFRPTIIDLRRLLADKDFQTTVRENAGLEGYSLLKEWVGSVAAGNTNANPATEVWEKAVGFLRRNATQAALLFRPSVFIQNFANPVLYAGAIDGFGHKEAFSAFYRRGVMDYLPKMLFNWKAQKELRDFVHSKSAFMADKATNPDFSLAETHNHLFGKDSKIQEFGAALMAATDDFTGIPMWLEAYNQGLDMNLEDEEAVRRADLLIERTLGSGRKYDTAQIQRAGELAKSLSMFYSFLNTEFNRWSAEYGKAQMDPKNVPAFLGFLAFRLLVFVPISALFSGKGPGDDEDKLKWWLKETLSYPLALFPGIREISSVAMDEALGMKSFGYRPSPAVAAIDASLGTVKAGARAAETGELQPFLESLTKTAAFTTPYPDQFNAWAWNAYDAFANGMSPQTSDLYRRRPTKER